MTPDKVYVITSQYSDHSGPAEVLCALFDKSKADWLAQFLRDRQPVMSEIIVHETTTLSNMFGTAAHD